MTSHTGKVNLKSIVEQVVDALKEQILKGEFLPGERLTEIPLSEQYNISRTSLREALRILENKGFVVTVPRRGTFITQLTTKEAQDIFVIRSGLESMAVSLAIQNQTPKVLQQLQEQHELMMAVGESGDSSRYNELDLVFHRSIYHASGNTILANMIENFNNQTMRYRMEYFCTQKRIKRSIEIHGTILEFFASRDSEGAEKFCRQTVLNNGALLINKILEEQESASVAS